jgi:dynein heavy chain 2
MELADQKNKLLRSMAGTGVEQLNMLQSKWDKFDLLMESQQMMMKEQVSTLSLTICSPMY